MKELLENIKNKINEFEQKIDNINIELTEMDKEIEENEGSYPGIEFGQEYESSSAYRDALIETVNVLKEVKSDVTKIYDKQDEKSRGFER